MSNCKELIHRFQSGINDMDYRFCRIRAGQIKWPETDVSIRPTLVDRIYGNGIVDTKLLLGGGTIFSKVTKEGVRTGKMGVLDASDFLASNFPPYLNRFIDPIEVPIYDGLSEELDTSKLENIELKVASAINQTPTADTFIMFAGSDMTEMLGTYLHNGLASELNDKSIRLFIVWANTPVSQKNSDAFLHLETALKSSRDKKRPGGVYIVSGNEIIPAVDSVKETYHDNQMRFYNRTSQHHVVYDQIRNEELAETADKLTQLFFGLDSFDDLIYKMDRIRFTYSLKAGWYRLGPGKSLIPRFSTHVSEEIMAQVHHRKKNPTNRPGVSSVGLGLDMLKAKEHMPLNVYGIQELIAHLRTSPYDHPKDATKKIVIRPANMIPIIPTYEEFEDSDAVLLILNHSATTHESVAKAIREICIRRRLVGKPLAVFAVTENGEPHVWNSEAQFYPSGDILRNYVLLLPSHIKPTIVKLWAAIHSFGYSPFKDIEEFYSFMLSDFAGELMDSISQDNLERVLINNFGNTQASIPKSILKKISK